MVTTPRPSRSSPLPTNGQTWPRPCFTHATANILNHLAPGIRAQMEHSFESVPVSRDVVLFDAADPGEFVWFPQGPLISLEQNGGLEVGVVGSEGVVGWTALFGCERSPYRAMVRGRDGTVLRVRTDVLTGLILARPSIGGCLNRFVSAIGVQMAETIGAFASHRIEVRLVRWLLLRHDRTGGDELLVQHDEIAVNLGARRATITDCLHILEGVGLIRCRRGKIAVRDRPGLQALAAGCYGAAESLYRDTIGSFGKGVGSADNLAFP
jgi:CRP-like cAMP-binding protein